jgi:hypothetical protein
MVNTAPTFPLNQPSDPISSLVSNQKAKQTRPSVPLITSLVPPRPPEMLSNLPILATMIPIPGVHSCPKTSSGSCVPS